MADTKISELPASSVGGADEFAVNEAGVSKKVTAAQLKGFASGISTLGSPAVDTLQEYINSTGSSGYFSGGGISDAGGGAVNIAAGSGFIRATATETDPLLSFEWPAFMGVAIPSDSIRYIYISYNSGSPTYVVSALEFDEDPEKIMLGLVINEAGAIHMSINLGVRLQESVGKAGRFLRRVLGIVRDVRRGGLMFGLTGTRQITVSPGYLWWGRTEYAFPAIDTAASGAFDIYYRSAGSGFTKVPAATQWPNTQYDNGTGTLATLAGGKWGVLWFYVELDSEVVMVYGQAQYDNTAAAEQAGPPATLPVRLSGEGILAARFIFQKSATTATIASAFDTHFNASGVTDHGDLAGLSDPDHPSTALAMSTTNVLVGRATAGAGPSEEIPCTAAGRAVLAAADAALVTAKVLSANLTLGGSAAEKVTGLDKTVGVGTWVFNYHIRYRSSVATTGIRCSVNHSGTVGSFAANLRWACDSSSDASSQAKQDANGAPVVMSSMSARAKSAAGWGPLGGVDAVNVDMLLIVEGVMVVTVSGDIQLYCGNEVNSPDVTVMANSAMILTKVA